MPNIYYYFKYPYLYSTCAATYYCVDTSTIFMGCWV